MSLGFGLSAVEATAFGYQPLAGKEWQLIFYFYSSYFI
jgi:hypothetical protein